jgi:Zn-dependent protease
VTQVLPTGQGSIRLFRVAGINVFLHWSWFLVAAYEIQGRTRSYSSLAWNVLEYLSLFVIVTMHEFGHALACRQVGGKAEQIVLWPLGGVAYVDPPQRPGATLWSIAAGPLVNVGLFFVLTPLLMAGRGLGWPDAMPNLYHLVFAVWIINLGLLVFNLLPVYPLDGGQILRSLLWFALGRVRSLTIATIVGFVGAAGLILLALLWQSIWIGVLSLFILMNCRRGWQSARALKRLADAPRHEGFACPACKAAPPAGEYWLCGKCRKPFDTFVMQATCPQCGTQFATTRCLHCGSSRPVSEWAIATPAPASL